MRSEISENRWEFLEKLLKLQLNVMVIWKFLAVLKLTENSRLFLLFRTDLLFSGKQSLVAPAC